MSIPTAVVALAADQAEAVSAEQCLEHGMTRAAIATQVRAGRWQRVHRGVFATFTGALEDRTRVWAALLAVGEGAAAADETAIWLATQKGRLELPVRVAVEAETRRVAPRGVVVTRRSGFETIDSDPPRLPLEAAVLNVADRSPVGEVVSLVCGVVGARRTTPERLRDNLEQRSRHRHRRLLTLMLDEVQEGATSTLELLDLRNDRAHGLPVADRQVGQRVGGQGRWLDAVVTLDGVTLVKELDGRLGHEGVGRFRDMTRDNAATVRGASSLRYGWTDLYELGCEVAAEQSLFWRRRTPRSVGAACSRTACRLEERVAALERLHPAIAS